MSLYSRIVLVTSAVLIIGGAAGLLAVETSLPDDKVIGRDPLQGDAQPRQEDWKTMPTPQRAREALFHSISARTAGFNTIDVAELSNAGKFWISMLMVVGGSPASTAGGMKTITLALLVLTAMSILRKRDEVEVFHRSISLAIIRRGVTLGVLFLGLVAATVLLLNVAMPGFSFIDLLFESCSACGTVGLSTGVTPMLNLFGKCVLMVAMFAGRIGPLTMLLAVTSHLRKVDYSYPLENVVIG